MILSDTIRSHFERARQALRTELRVDAERALDDLEHEVSTTITSLMAELDAVALATVRGVEWLEEEQHRVEELQEQQRELSTHYSTVKSKLAELERENQSVAEAAVEAVLLMDESQGQIDTLKQQYEEVMEAKRALADQAERLRLEAEALAAANVEAVLLAAEKEEVASSIAKKAEAIEESNKALSGRVFIDELTELFNHRYFKEQIGPEMARAERYDRELSLAFIDIDHFKRLNDTFGHQTGNLVLRELGLLLKDQTRASDLPVRTLGNPFAVRYGGEEFVLILPETGLEGAFIAADRIRQLVAARDWIINGQDVGPITISAGVAAYRDGDMRPGDLVRRADEALYQAKRTGRNRVVAVQPDQKSLPEGPELGESQALAGRGPG